MSDGVIIRVEGLGKRYRLGAGRSNERYTALRDVISENVKGVFKKLKPGNLKTRNGSDDLSISDSPNVSVSDSQRVSVSRPSDEFWALKDVSFEVKQGEVLASGSEGTTLRPGCLTGRKRARRGIMGRNSDKESRAGGAGKSTLLKILSRIT